MKRLSQEKIRDLLKEVEDHYCDAKSQVTARLDTWMTRASFYRGNHYTIQDGLAWLDPDEPSGEAREIHNYCRSFVRAAVANRLKAFPNPEVPAASADQRAVARAEATDRLLKSFVDDDIISKEELVRAYITASTLGSCWLKIYWDPFAGKPTYSEESLIEKTIKDELSGEEISSFEYQTDLFGEPIIATTYEGRICVEAVDPIDGLHDPTARREREMGFWIHRKLRPVRELEEKFPKDYFGKDTKGRFGRQKRDETMAERDFVQGVQDGAVTDMGAAHASDLDLAELVEYWRAPSPLLQNGMLFVYSGTVVLYAGPIPYKPARLPVVLVLGDNIVPNGLYADGVIEDLIPIQRTLNRLESKKREWVDKLLSPPILNPLGSNIDADLFGQIAGQVIDHTPGLKPQVMEVPNIPNSLFEASAQLVVAMKDISGYSDISRGDVPQGISSGRAIAFLRENEQTIREPDMLMHKSAMIRVMQHCLYLSKQYYQQYRMVRVLGEDGWTYHPFQEEDYDWFVDLAPESVSGSPNSRALKWAETIEAFEKGIFNDEIPGSREVRRLLGYDSTSRSTVDASRHHRSIARMENTQALMGQTVKEVKQFEDDEIHLEEHDRFRNSLEYINMPPERQLQFDMHCEMHQANLQQKQALFGQMQEMQGGGPPQGIPQIPTQGAPLDGGHPTGEPPPETTDEYVKRQTQTGDFPG